MNKQNLLMLREEGIDLADLKFVDNAIRDYEEDEFYDGEITKSKVELETEELIQKLKSDGKISRMSELCFRILPIGLRIKMLHDEMDFRASFISVLYGDLDVPLSYYYDDKRRKCKMIMDEYNEFKNSPNDGKYPETHLDTLRKQKIKLMRKKKR